MGIIKNYLRKNVPFAVMQSFVWFKGISQERQRVYELLSIGKDSKKEYFLNAQDLTDSDLKEFKDNNSVFDIVLTNSDGKIYEVRGRESFKDYHNSLLPKKMKA